MILWHSAKGFRNGAFGACTFQGLLLLLHDGCTNGGRLGQSLLERVINYRIGFSEPLLIFVWFSFLPFVTTEGFETIGGGHVFIMALRACREGLDTCVSCLQAALCYAWPITAPGSYL